jgi:hypothetical protein
MRYKIITVIGTLITITSLDLAIASLTARVDAQSAGSNSETGDFTLSGESLQKVEGLSIEDDYQDLFTRTGKQVNTFSNFDDFNNSRTQDDSVWQINERLKIEIDQPLSSSNFSFPSRQNRSIFIDNLNRFEVQYELLE